MNGVKNLTENGTKVKVDDVKQEERSVLNDI